MEFWGTKMQMSLSLQPQMISVDIFPGYIVSVSTDQ